MPMYSARWTSKTDFSTLISMNKAASSHPL